MGRAHGHAQEGFTLVEVLVASVVLLTGMLGTFLLIKGATSTAFADRAREGATNLGRQVVEAVHTIPYSQLNDQTIVSKLQNVNDLGDGDLSAGGYQVERRGVLYTITANTCSLDDPADGTGPHDAGSYCADSAGGSGLSATLDFAGVNVDGSVQLGGSSPDDYKRVVVSVAWNTQTGQGRTIHLDDLIPNPGNSAGPAISAFAAAGLSTPVVTSSLTSSLNFNLTTDQTPSTVNWTVNGVVQGQATGSGTGWGFNWPISSLADGTYLIGSQAYDANGLTGAARSLSITLNRNAPAAPQDLQAGRNGSLVDLQWDANADLDLSGYRVYRVDLGGPTLVCSLTKATSCQDTNPPALPALAYYAVAVDRDPNGNLREGLPSVSVSVPATNNPPGAPSGLAASVINGTTVLAWNPSAGDPDLGDSVAFYRIYRDGKAFADRYDVTGAGTISTYTDNRTNGTTHTYWVTAVDTHLGESAFAGPVTR